MYVIRTARRLYATCGFLAMRRRRCAGRAVGIVHDLLLQLPLMLLCFAEYQTKLAIVFIFQRFAHQRTSRAQVLRKRGLFANTKLSSTSLAVQPLRFQALDRIDDKTINELQTHAPVQHKGTIIKAAKKEQTMSKSGKKEAHLVALTPCHLVPAS